MHLDGTKGRQLLRVLLQTAMINHSPLASQALKLIIRHFSQREEMVDPYSVQDTRIGILACDLEWPPVVDGSSNFVPEALP